MLKKLTSAVLYSTRFPWIISIAALILLGFQLESRELWTQEWRWAEVCWEMLYRHDFLHPYLLNQPYYDKPLLSYWLMLGFHVVVDLGGALSLTALRLPSVIAGLFSVYATWYLARYFYNELTARVASWLLISCYFFVFWSRIASTDILNVAGVLGAMVWYIHTRNKPTAQQLHIFAMILAFTALLKGLIGIALIGLMLLPDLCHEKRWKQYLRPATFSAVALALFIYAVPFLASAYFQPSDYTENGWSLVYRENILRFFQPFDHEGALYTYFIYLPIYLLPWAPAFILACCDFFKHRSARLSWNERWLTYGMIGIFIFLTMSGSRRSYYILPLIPFALMFTAAWLTAGSHHQKPARRLRSATYGIAATYLALLLYVQVFTPWYYQNRLETFAATVRTEAIKQKPWEAWDIVLFDGESKLTFYLDLKKPLEMIDLPREAIRIEREPDEWFTLWPSLNNRKALLITQKANQDFFEEQRPNDRVIEAPVSPLENWLGESSHLPIAFIPKR